METFFNNINFNNNVNKFLSLAYEFRNNCHLFMNSDNSDYRFFHINYDPPREYQFVNHVVYVTRRYKDTVLDNQSISLLAINK